MDRALEQKKHDLLATLSELTNRLRAIEKQPLPSPEGLAQRNNLVDQVCAKLNVPPGLPVTEDTYVHGKYCAVLREFAPAVAERCADLGMSPLFEIPEKNDSWGGPALVVWTDPFTGMTRGLKPKTDSVDYLRPIETMFRYLESLTTPDYQMAKQDPWNQEKQDQWRREQERSVGIEQWAKDALNEPRVGSGERQAHTKSSDGTPANDRTDPLTSDKQAQDVDADSDVLDSQDKKKSANSETSMPIKASVEEAPDAPSPTQAQEPSTPRQNGTQEHRISKPENGVVNDEGSVDSGEGDDGTEVFIQVGNGFLVRFEGEESVLPDTKGVRIIRKLIVQQGHPVDTWELDERRYRDDEVSESYALKDMAGDSRDGPERTDKKRRETIEKEALIDEDAIRNSLRELTDLRSELEREGLSEAERNEIQHRIDDIEGYLRKYTDNRGQPRKERTSRNHAANRVRVSIGEFKKSKKGQMPRFIAHLDSAISTRDVFVYRPSTEIRWEI